jgi:hypothetical protein
MAKRPLVVILIAACSSLALPAAADSEFLPGAARELSSADSASRDAPVFELAHGRRAYGSLGMAPGILAVRRGDGAFRLGLSALFAWENDGGASLLPRALLWREREALSLALGRRGVFGSGSLLEIAAELGHEGAHTEPGAALDAWRSYDIPFGAGGFFFAPDVALRMPAAPQLELVSRLGDRMYVNAFPRAVGAREASDYAADFLGEGLMHAPFADLVFRWRLSETAQPLFAVHGEVLVPHDDSARSGVRSRALLGLALPGRAGELVPFLAGEAGNGWGYFVNRRELQLSLGVRFVLEPRGGEK